MRWKTICGLLLVGIGLSGCLNTHNGKPEPHPDNISHVMTETPADAWRKSGSWDKSVDPADEEPKGCCRPAAPPTSSCCPVSSKDTCAPIETPAPRLDRNHF